MNQKITLVQFNSWDGVVCQDYFVEFIDYYSSDASAGFAAGAWILPSLSAEITLAAVDIDGSICSMLAIFIARRVTLCRLPNDDSTRWRASSSSLATISCVND